MSRDITTAFRDEITADQLTWRFLYKAEFPSGDLRLWNGLGDLTFRGEIYTGAGNLLGHTPIEETKSLEANNVTYRLTGVNSAILSIALSEDYWGTKITSWFAVLNTAGALISEPYQLFQGKIDIMDITNTGSDAYIDVRCESDFIDFKTARETLRTPENQKLYYPNDTFFDSVPTIQDKTLTWGAGRTD